MNKSLKYSILTYSSVKYHILYYSCIGLLIKYREGDILKYSCKDDT